VSLVVAAAAPARALVPADVSLTSGPVSTVVSVSPDVFYDAASSTYYLFTTGMKIGVYRSTDGHSWTEATGAATPIGPYFDPSVVALPDGSYRMYYVYRSGMGNQPCSGKELRYATSPDLLRWTAQPQTLLADLGCGVPNVVRLTDGTYRLYYVRGGPGTPHGTYMATSADGLTWNPTNQLLTPQDFVDPSVVQLADGTWLMFTADFSAVQPPPPGFVQRLYVGTSDNGLAWDFGSAKPLHSAPSSQGAFDPDAVVLPDGNVRIWWAQGRDAMAATVAAGTVSIDTPAPVLSTPGKPVITTTKSGARVTWTYPVGANAPDGYTVQVKSGATWKDVGTTTATSRTLTWSQVGAKKGASFSVRVVAFIGETKAMSAAATAKRPR
jgi:hypothetical protein